MEQLFPSDFLLSKENLRKYYDGCGYIGIALNDACTAIRNQGKRPTVLIPSRGAVPLFILAEEVLKTFRDGELLANLNAVSYYPRNIFEHLSDGVLISADPKTSLVDVVLYPFTADVSMNPSQNKDIARELRRSSVKAFLDIVSGERNGFDLNWYLFLLKKLKTSKGMNPTEIINSLLMLNPRLDREVVLVDTVISGRAADDITTAFQHEGYPVFSVLAINNLSGIKFKPNRRQRIISNCSFAPYLNGTTSSCTMIEMPLISEDQGAALLGLTALNFANFNKLGLFRYIHKSFSDDFLPQSCLWTLPPAQYNEIYLNLFRSFLAACNGTLDYEKWVARDLNPLKALMKRNTIDPKEIKEITGIEQPARETSSHIVSIDLPDALAKDWIREFLREFPHFI